MRTQPGAGSEGRRRDNNSLLGDRAKRPTPSVLAAGSGHDAQLIGTVGSITNRTGTLILVASRST